MQLVVKVISIMKMSNATGENKIMHELQMIILNDDDGMEVNHIPARLLID